MEKRDLTGTPLGKKTPAVEHYDPGLLCPLPRSETWARYGHAQAPYRGVDIWNAWEIAWLDRRGLPHCAVGEFRVPLSSPNIIESKSMKLYLNAFSQTRFDDMDSVARTIAGDLSACAGDRIAVALFGPEDTVCETRLPEGQCLDGLDVTIENYHREPALLTHSDGEVKIEKLYSHLLKTNCPVTGQPDWGSLLIAYSGRRIDPHGLLKYIVSLRNESDFHEQCTETLFLDILQRCAPASLTVSARYLRRGGIDINPWRSTGDDTPLNARLLRQ